MRRKIQKFLAGKGKILKFAVRFKQCAKDEFYAMKVVKTLINGRVLQKYDF